MWVDTSKMMNDFTCWQPGRQRELAFNLYEGERRDKIGLSRSVSSGSHLMPPAADRDGAHRIFGVPFACEAESFCTQLNCTAAHCVYHSTQNSNKAAASLHIIQSASRYAHMAGAWPCRSLSPLVLIARLRHAQSGCICIQSA